jgi:uncharacterized protein
MRALSFGALSMLAVRCGLPAYLRHGKPQPLDDDEQAFLRRVLGDLKLDQCWDVHCHLVGRGVGSGCRVSPELTSRFHPWKNLQFDLYAAAAGIPVDDTTPDSAYVDRLVELTKFGIPDGRCVLIAFDEFVDEHGVVDSSRTEIHTPNDVVRDVVRAFPERFRYGCSVHPYRTDALDRLQQAIDDGAVAVKWLPNAMNIDPSLPRNDAFYKKLADNNVVLLSHTGDESAVDARDLQAFGHPHRLRRALDAGVTVIAAHVATTGTCDTTSCTDVLLEMMRSGTPNLYADISAVTQRNRAHHLKKLLTATDLHHRFLQGTDYPLPAIDPLISTGQLVDEGFLSEQDRVFVNRIFHKNPWLFDLLLKRCLRVVDGEKQTRFSNEVFETRRVFRA